MSAAYQTLKRYIDDGELVIADGATGTEIERRGVPQLDNAWNGGGALSHPDIVRDVHGDYIEAGAKIIISNTFATHLSALSDAGAEQDFERLNSEGIKLALESRDRSGRKDVTVAAGISYWSWSGNKPDLATLRENTQRQVDIIAEAGAELIILEMMIDIDRMQVLVDVALRSKLPLWVGFTTAITNGGQIVLRNGEALTDAIAVLNPEQIDLINIMHTDVSVISPSLDVLKTCWHGPFGAYAHSGGSDDHKWRFNAVIDPDGYLNYARQWRQQGAQLVGGCCGTSPEHVKLLEQHFVGAKNG